MPVAAKKVYKIAILNCYLQGGHTEMSEIESAKRFQIAAANLGYQAELFARSEDLYDYAPDIVIAQAYQDAKLTPFPTYGTLTMPPSWVRDVPRFVRNIMSYDGYITVSDSVVQYVNGVASRFQKNLTSVFAAFSMPHTPYVPLNLSKAYAAYIGTNWDGSRHGNFFGQFDEKDILKCFGPEKSWSYLSRSVYGHAIPFDGHSILDVYRRAGIGLCFNHKDFDREGISSLRIFEIPAASAVMIAGNNPLIKSIYGDSAIYINSDQNDHSLVAQSLEDAVMWVRSHSSEALEMAREANRIFNEKLALEIMIANLIKEHERTLAAAHARSTHAGRTSSQGSNKLTVICNQSEALDTQLAALADGQSRPKEVIVLADRNPRLSSIFRRNPIKAFAKKYENSFNVRQAKRLRTILESTRAVLPSIRTTYVAVLDESDIPFYDHYARALSFEPTDSVIFSGVVECSSDELLPEIMQCDFLVPRQEKRRLVQFTALTRRDLLEGTYRPALGSLVFPAELLRRYIDDFHDMSSLLQELGKQAEFVFSPYVTLETRGYAEAKGYLSFFHLPN